MSPLVARRPELHAGGWCYPLTPQSQPPGILASHPPLTQPPSWKHFGGSHASLASRRHVGDIAATGSSMVGRGPPHLLAASSTELSPTICHQLHHTSCSLPNLHCISRQQLAQHCVQVDASCLLPCPVLPCNAQHTIVVATIHTHTHCLNNAPS